MKQTDAQLIVTRERPDGAVMTSYALDGSESRSPEGAATRSRWEGAALLTTGSVSMPGRRDGPSLKTREVRTLSADGETQTVTVTLETPGGKQVTTASLSRAGGSSSVTVSSQSGPRAVTTLPSNEVEAGATDGLPAGN